MYNYELMRLPGSHFARNLVERRNLLFQLVRRDFMQRFVGSAAGWIWGVIHPLTLLVSWVFVFQVCMKIPPPRDAITTSYPIFLFCGFLPWMLFSDTVQRSATSMLDHQNLITKTIFPAEVVPVAIFLSALMHHAIALALALGAAAIWLKHVGVNMLYLPVFTFFLGLFAIGVAWIVSSLHVYVRDTAQVLSVVLSFWFWFTPIFIYEEMVPARFRFVLHVNPLAPVVKAYREMLLTSRTPSPEAFGTIAVAGVGAFVIGGLFFRHLKRGFADVL